MNVDVTKASSLSTLLFRPPTTYILPAHLEKMGAESMTCLDVQVQLASANVRWFEVCIITGQHHQQPELAVCTLMIHKWACKQKNVDLPSSKAAPNLYRGSGMGASAV